MVDWGLAVDLGLDGYLDLIGLWLRALGKIGDMYLYYGHIETSASL